MKKVLVCILILTCCYFTGKAQQVVSSGGYEEKDGITVDWILGGSLEDLTGYAKSTIYEPEEDQLSESALSVKVYPNFTRNLITIDISPFELSNLTLI